MWQWARGWCADESDAACNAALASSLRIGVRNGLRWYAIHDSAIFRLDSLFDHDATEPFGNPATCAIFLCYGIREASLYAEDARCPSGHKAHGFTAETFVVAIFANPDAQFRVFAVQPVQARQAKKRCTFAFPYREDKLRSFCGSQQPLLPDAIEGFFVGGRIPRHESGEGRRNAAERGVCVVGGKRFD